MRSTNDTLKNQSLTKMEIQVRAAPVCTVATHFVVLILVGFVEERIKNTRGTMLVKI